MVVTPTSHPLDLETLHLSCATRSEMRVSTPLRVSILGVVDVVE